MLKLIVNNQEVDLGSLKSITSKYNGGIFDFDEILGSYSIPFTLPLNDINRPIFNFPYRVENIDVDVREYPAELWHSGTKIFDAAITAKIFQKKAGISCNIDTDNGQFYKKLKTKRLNKHDYGGPKQHVWKSEYSVDTDDYLLYAAENYNFCDGTAWEDEWKAGSSILKSQQNQYFSFPGLGINVFYHPSHLVFATTPFPLLWRTLRYLFQNLGFLYTDDFFSQDDYKTLNIFNVNNAVEAEFYVDGNETKTRNVVNNVDIANHLPDMDTANFIRTIQAFFNIFFHTSSTNIKVIDRLEMIKNTSYNDITDKITGDYKKTITGYSANGVSFQILKDDNDLNVKDFEDLNQHPSPEHVNEELYTPRSNEVIYEILDRHYKKFANQSEVLGSGSFDIWRWFNFPVTFSKVGEPEIYVKQAPWLIGEQEFELTNLPTPAPDQIIGRTSAATKPYNTPKIRQPGNSFVNSTENNFELRLMYYAGVQETLLNDRDLTGNLIDQPVGDANLNDKEISARWSYENRWKEFIEWYKEVAKVEYEQDIQFSASEIKNFDYSKKYLIDGNSYFIKSFSVQFLRNEIKPAKCLMIKSE